MLSDNKHRKVLHVRSSGALLGAERVILELLNHSPKFNYNTSLAILSDQSSSRNALANAARHLGIPVIVINSGRYLDFSTIRELRNFAKKEKPDIIHTHGYKEDIYCTLALASTPKIATNHLWKRTSVKLRFYSYLDAMFLRFFDRVVAVSRNVEEEMMGAFIAKKKIRWIPNGIGFPSIKKTINTNLIVEKKKMLKIDPNAIIIGSISSLTPEKGIDIFLEALKDVHVGSEDRIEVLIIGDGCEREFLEKKVSKLSLDMQIKFLGFRNDVESLLPILDIFVLSSRKEGLPIALLEAMAMGRAIVATQVGDVAYAVEHEVNGLLVSPEDKNMLAQALSRLIKDGQFRRKIGQNSLQQAYELFSSEAMTCSYCSIYDEILTEQ